MLRNLCLFPKKSYNFLRRIPVSVPFKSYGKFSYGCGKCGDVHAKSCEKF